VGPSSTDSGVGEEVTDVDGVTVVVRVDLGVSEPPHAAAPTSSPTTIAVPNPRVMADMRTTPDSSVRLPRGPVNRLAA